MSTRFSDKPSAHTEPTTTLMLKGVCTSAGDRYIGDVVVLPLNESRHLAAQDRAISEPTDEQVEQVRRDVQEREARGEILRPPAA